MSDIQRDPYNKRGFTIPVEERIRYYYILGYGTTDIVTLVSGEYQEFESIPIDYKTVSAFIKTNKKALMDARQNSAIQLRKELSIQLKENFTIAQFTEVNIVETYCKKIKELIEELEVLDISEKNEDGYFRNMGQYATLVMAINKTHEMIEKLSGTAASREVMIYMKKAYVKEQAAKGMGLHEQAMEADIVFIDDPSGLENFGPNFGKGIPDLKKA